MLDGKSLWKKLPVGKHIWHCAGMGVIQSAGINRYIPFTQQEQDMIRKSIQWLNGLNLNVVVEIWSDSYPI